LGGDVLPACEAWWVCGHAPPRKILKIDAKILQHFHTLGIALQYVLMERF